MAVLGLRFCARAFSSWGKRGPLFIAVRGTLTVEASLVVEHRLQTRRLSSCGSRAQLLRGMWDLPRPGLKPVSPASAGRLSTTAPPRKPPVLLLISETVLFWCSLHHWLLLLFLGFCPFLLFLLALGYVLSKVTFSTLFSFYNNFLVLHMILKSVSWLLPQ